MSARSEIPKKKRAIIGANLRQVREAKGLKQGVDAMCDAITLKNLLQLRDATAAMANTKELLAACDSFSNSAAGNKNPRSVS